MFRRDPGGASAYLRAMFGAGSQGLGRSDVERSALTEVLPIRTPAGVTCPRCGSAMQALPGRSPAIGGAYMADCPACGFVALCRRA